MLLFFFFFFSSRRRHTRCGRDWSSDVCSSDLPFPVCAGTGAGHGILRWTAPVPAHTGNGAQSSYGAGEIGRASCRERVGMSGGGESLKEKERNGRRRLYQRMSRTL